jgi:TonB family protein
MAVMFPGHDIVMKALLLALVAPSTIVIPPPIPAPPAPPNTERALLDWDPGEVRCGGSIERPEFLARPLASLAWGVQVTGDAVTYAFAIDSSGRTMGIRRVAKDARIAGADDIAPSLAASRFSAGEARSDCTITYAPGRTSLSATPVEDLIAYSVNAISGPLPKEAWERIHSDSECRDVRALGIQARAFPDFKAIAATPGVREWSMVGYDIQDDGATSNITTIAGSRNAALDAASRDAVAKARYYKGGRKGCRFPYWRNPAPIPAPPAPDEQRFRPAGAACPERQEWAVQPALRFPEPYRRRAIEGWAIVTYDVAPWGEVSNIQVVASEPTEDFGAQAAIVVRGGKVATTQGFVGCAERIRFVMGSDERDNE